MRKDLQWNTCAVIKLNMMAFLPQCMLRLCCLKLTAERKRLSQTYLKLRNEVSIAEIVRQLRVLKAAARVAVSEEKWERLQHQFSVKVQDSDGSEQ